MPELPEVEAVVRALKHGGRGAAAVLGRRVERVQVPSARILQAGRDRLARDVEGAVIDDVGRRGKYIVLTLSRAKLVLHLRMTGDLVVVPADTRAPRPYERLRLHLAGGAALSFDDPRHLGQAWVLDDEGELLAKLAPDPLDPRLDAAALRARLGRGRRAVKAALLDQTAVSGVGNIWADEALFGAHLHPNTPVGALTDDDAERLLGSLRSVLGDAVRELIESGIAWVYRGQGEKRLPGRVHGRAGEPCPRCEATLSKTRVAGRGTVLCPRCQPLAPA